MCLTSIISQLINQSKKKRKTYQAKNELLHVYKNVFLILCNIKHGFQYLFLDIDIQGQMMAHHFFFVFFFFTTSRGRRFSSNSCLWTSEASSSCSQRLSKAAWRSSMAFVWLCSAATSLSFRSVISDSLSWWKLCRLACSVSWERHIEKVWTENNADSKGSLTPGFHQIGLMQEFRVVDNFSKKEIWLRDFRKHLELELW